MQVSEIMSDAPVTVDRLVPLWRAAVEMRTWGVGAVLVCDGERVVGILTDRDIAVRAVANRTERASVYQAMSAPVHAVTPHDDVDLAVDVMMQHRIRHVPVCSDGACVGVVTQADVAHHLPSAVLAELIRRTSAAPRRVTQAPNPLVPAD
jgi:CBS domain-containing protein